MPSPVVWTLTPSTTEPVSCFLKWADGWQFFSAALAAIRPWKSSRWPKKPATTGCRSCAASAPGATPRPAPALTVPPCACPKAWRSFRRSKRTQPFTSGLPPLHSGAARSLPQPDSDDPLQADLAAIATAAGHDRSRAAERPRPAQTSRRSCRCHPPVPPHRHTPPGRSRRRGPHPSRAGRRLPASLAAGQNPARLPPLPPRSALARSARAGPLRGHRVDGPRHRRHPRGIAPTKKPPAAPGAARPIRPTAPTASSCTSSKPSCR